MKGTRNMEAETETKAMEEYYLLAWYPWLAPSAFYTTQDHLSRGGIIQSRLRFPYQPLIKKCRTDLPTGQFGGAVFSAEVPSSQMTLAWAKLTKNKTKITTTTTTTTPPHKTRHHRTTVTLSVPLVRGA